MSTTTKRLPVASFALDEETTTTTGIRSVWHTFAGRTVEPLHRDKARPLVVRFRGGHQPLMWPKAYERDPDERITTCYVLTVELADEFPLNPSETRWISRPPGSLATMFRCPRPEHTRPTIEPKTRLGERLLELRRRIVAAGTPLLDWSDIENEVRSRRGERD